MATSKDDNRYQHCENLKDGKPCGNSVGDESAEWSRKKYGKVLCFECLRKQGGVCIDKEMC